jgi:hypothetical protein
MQKTNLLDNSNLKINNREKVIKEFSKPIFENKFFINKEFLLLNSNKYEFKKESWVQNPKYFSLEVYGEAEYYRIILLVNNLGSMIQFKSSNLKDSLIIVPRENNIGKIISLLKG